MSQVIWNLSRAPLGALGIPSDIEFFFDGATAGKLFRSVRSTMMFTGIVLSTPGFNDGSTCVFAGCPPEGLDGRAAAKTEVLKALLCSDPVRLGNQVLRSRLGVIIADGQYTDGEASKHNHLKVPEGLFHWIGQRQVRAVWDSFHRIHKARC